MTDIITDAVITSASVGAAVVSGQQGTQMQMMSAITNGQAQNTVAQVGELREIQRLLSRMATKDDMYNAFKGASQTSI